MNEEEIMEALGGIVSIASGSIRDCKECKCLSLSLKNEKEIEGWAEISELIHLESLDISNTDVNDLTPLQTLENLISLDLSGSSVKDLSPLTNLKQLETLNISQTQVDDLTPLVNLKKLRKIQVGNSLDKSPLHNLEGLSNLINLREIDLRNTNITDLKPISGLTELKKLSLYKSSVSDLTPIVKLQKLEELGLGSTQVTNLKPLEKLLGLRRLEIGNLNINNLSPLSRLKKLETLFINKTFVTDLNPISNLSNLTLLNMSDSHVDDLRPIAKLNKLETLNLSNTVVKDLSALQELEALRSLVLDGCTLSEQFRDFWFKESLIELDLINATIPGVPSRLLNSCYDEQGIEKIRHFFENVDTKASDREGPGWTAIDVHLETVIGTSKPNFHLAPEIYYWLGGDDPLDGISIYERNTSQPHLHFVSYGMSELYENKGSENSEFSRWGFEFTFRLSRDASFLDKDKLPASWVANFMQNLARYVYDSGNWFKDGHFIPANGPIKANSDSDIIGVIFTTDPELKEIETLYGKICFLQIVGITSKELEALNNKNITTEELLVKLQDQDPLMITHLQRTKNFI